MQNHPNAKITKFSLGNIFAELVKEGATVGNAIKGHEYRVRLFPFEPPTIPKDKVLPSQYFHQFPFDHHQILHIRPRYIL
jgi:hypothetical protein